jgi:drug/metabolite transporter (DMT)-like permease
MNFQKTFRFRNNMASLKTLVAGARTSTKLLPYLALALGTLGLGMSGIFTTWAGVPGPVSGFYRMGVAAAVMAIPFGVEVRRRTLASWKHVGLAALAGLFFAGDMAAWNTSVLMIPAGPATLFGNTAPIWVGLGALVLFKEKLNRSFWAGLALSLIGAAVIVSGRFNAQALSAAGSFLALLAGGFYAGFFLATQRAREGMSSLGSWWVSAVTSTLTLLVVIWLFGQSVLGYPANTYVNLILLALVSQVTGYLAINYALGHLPASIVSPTLLGQPVLTALLAVPLLGQPLTPAMIVGGALILGGIWLVNQRR